MKLSMWILADWLKKYNPIIKIEDSKLVIRNVKLFSNQTPSNSEFVYIGRQEDFISGAGHGVVCVHGHDMLILNADDIEDVFNEIINAFEYYNNFFNSLKDIILSKGSLQDILNESYNVMKNSLTISDAGHFLVAHYITENMSNLDIGKYVLENNMLPLSFALSINKDPHFRSSSSNTYIYENCEFPTTLALRKLFKNTSHVGWIAISEEKTQLTPGCIQIIDLLGDIIENWLRINDTQNDIASYNKLLFSALSGTNEDLDRFSQSLSSIGWEFSDEKSLILLLCLDDNKDIFLTLATRFENIFPACCATIYKSYLVLLINQNLTDYKSFIINLKNILETTNCFCGISYTFKNTDYLLEHYIQAEISIKFGKQESGEIYHCEDFAVIAALSTMKTAYHTDLKHPALLKLKKYDAEENTDFYNTLKVILINERNYTISAKILCIHKNSLAYRVKRIEEIMEVDLDNPDIRIHLLISCYIDD